LSALRRPAAPTALRGFMRVQVHLAETGIDVLVVDDAHRLAYNTMEALRRLQDRTGIGLVLMGPSRTAALLQRRCDELWMRVERIHEMDGVRPREVFGILNALGKRWTGRAAWQQVEISRTLVMQSGGNFRLLLAVLREALVLTRARRRALCAGLVVMAAKTLAPPGLSRAG